MKKRLRSALILILTLLIGVAIGGAITDHLTQPTTIYIYHEPPKVLFI